MRRFVPVLIAMVAATAALASIAGLARASATSVMDTAGSTCNVEVMTVGSSRIALLGEQVRTNQGVVPVCAEKPWPFHAALALDVSVSMGLSGTLHEEPNAATRRLARGLHMPNHPGTEMGVVQYHKVAQTLADLTDDEGRVLRAIDRATGSLWGDSFAKGIEEAVRVLVRGRDRPSAPNNRTPSDVIVLFSDGPSDENCDDAVAAAARARSQGVLVATVCIGDQCNAACTRRIASSPR